MVDQVWNVFQAILAGELPEKGSVIGAQAKTNCDVCTRKKGEERHAHLRIQAPAPDRIGSGYMFPDPGRDLLGPATRAGCGLPCVNGNMPCRGCYGPPDGVVDQGSKLVSAIGALVDTDDPASIAGDPDRYCGPGRAWATDLDWQNRSFPT